MGTTWGKHAKTLLRVGLCGAALFVVLRTVSVRDRVELLDEQSLAGTVTPAGDAWRVELPGGDVRTVSRAAVAIDAAGNARVLYGLRSILRDSGKLLLIAGVAVLLVVPLLQAVRLWILLRAQDISTSFREQIRLAFVGNFLNFAAPFGSTAGDVYKAVALARGAAGKSAEAAALVIFDRALGLLVLLLSVGLIAWASGPASELAPLRHYLLGFTGAIVGGIGLWLAPPVRRLPLVRRLIAMTPRQDLLQRIDAAARRVLDRRGALTTAVIVTLVLQLFAAGSFACVCAALGMHLDATQPLAFYAHFSAGEIVRALPGPPQGLGTMELAYTYFFASLGSPSQIVSAALALRLVNLACALPGLLLVAAGTVTLRPAATAGSADKPDRAVGNVIPVA
jgi:uncharacterized membrane protein YbhN (UPF0104 family)